MKIIGIILLIAFITLATAEKDIEDYEISQDEVKAYYENTITGRVIEKPEINKLEISAIILLGIAMGAYAWYRSKNN